MTERHQPLTAAKNAPPKNVYEALRRLRNCNKKQLADALGIGRHTLTRWTQLEEAGEPASEAARNATGRLLRKTLKDAHCLNLLDE